MPCNIWRLHFLVVYFPKIASHHRQSLFRLPYSHSKFSTFQRLEQQPTIEIGIIIMELVLILWLLERNLEIKNPQHFNKMKLLKQCDRIKMSITFFRNFWLHFRLSVSISLLFYFSMCVKFNFIPQQRRRKRSRQLQHK